MAARVRRKHHVWSRGNTEKYLDAHTCLHAAFFFCVFFYHHQHAEKNKFYDLVDKDMQGNEVKMETFKGDVLCVVNVASKWGLTKANYVQFSKLYDTYNAQGFKILAFPCNQFGAQEPVRIIYYFEWLIVA